MLAVMSVKSGLRSYGGLHQKWFDNGKFLKPEFTKVQKSHEISRETLILLLSTAIQTKIAI